MAILSRHERGRSGEGVHFGAAMVSMPELEDIVIMGEPAAFDERFVVRSE